MNAYQDAQTSGNNSFHARGAAVHPTFPCDLGAGLFSNGPVQHSTPLVPRQEGTAVFENYEHEAAIEDVRREFMLPSDASVVTFLSEHRTIRILANGRGPGIIMGYLPACDYLGFDLSPEYIEQAKKRYPKARLLRAC